MNNNQQKDLDEKGELNTDSYKERELRLKEREVDLKELEIKTQLENNRNNRWISSPLLVGIISVLFGSLGTAFFQGNSNIQLERQKFEFSLILKALEGKDKNILMDSNDTARKISLLIDLDLIKSLDKNIVKKLAKNPNDIPNFDDKSREFSTAFSCEIVDGVSTTVVGHPDRGNISFIKWKKKKYPNNLTANEQCKMVSERLQTSREKGILNFIVAGLKNGKKVICASRTNNNICEFELFEVSLSTDSQSIIKEIYKINTSAANQPLNQ